MKPRIYLAWLTRADFAAHHALDPHGLQPAYEAWQCSGQQKTRH